MASTDFIARHILWVMGILTLCMLAGTYVFWRLIESHGAASWAAAVKALGRLNASSAVGRLKQYPVVGWTSTRAGLLIEYVGLLAIFGFIAAVCATVAFFEIADEIGVADSLAEFDAALSESLRQWVPREVLELFALVTRLGDTEVLFVLSLVVLTVLVFQRRWLLGIGWAIATASGGLLNRLLKSIFERTRPVHDHGLIAETYWSFPSGHASGSLLIYGLLTYLLVKHVRRALHLPIALLGITVVVFVGTSRIVLNVHYFSDVLAGFVSAAAWVAISIAVLETIDRRIALRGTTQI